MWPSGLGIDGADDGPQIAPAGSAQGPICTCALPEAVNHVPMTDGTWADAAEPKALSGSRRPTPPHVSLLRQLAQNVGGGPIDLATFGQRAADRARKRPAGRLGERSCATPNWCARAGVRWRSASCFRMIGPAARRRAAPPRRARPAGRRDRANDAPARGRVSRSAADVRGARASGPKDGTAPGRAHARHARSRWRPTLS